MIDQKKKASNLVILIFFFLTISFANFFHTEKTLFDNDDCPACRLLKSTQATSQIHFFHFAQPALLEILQIIELFNYSYIFVLYPSSRSPPQA
jgi:hypothetical protein